MYLLKYAVYQFVFDENLVFENICKLKNIVNKIGVLINKTTLLFYSQIALYINIKINKTIRKIT